MVLCEVPVLLSFNVVLQCVQLVETGKHLLKHMLYIRMMQYSRRQNNVPVFTPLNAVTIAIVGPFLTNV